jgi:hypothetical protein
LSELPHFLDYYWKNGKPVGSRIGSSKDKETFKVITDPYRKRFSVEKYAFGTFDEVIYDSSLFDFRHLKSEENAAWQRECIEELPDQTRSLIRSMDDRIILIEEAMFQGLLCEGCNILSPHGVLIATQTIKRTSKGDPFNGVIFQDRTGRPVIIKKYEIDDSVTFTELLSEQWEHIPQSL